MIGYPALGEWCADRVRALHDVEWHACQRDTQHQYGVRHPARTPVHAPSPPQAGRPANQRLVPFVLESYGGLGKEAVTLLNTLSQHATEKSSKEWFRDAYAALSVVLQRNIQIAVIGQQQLDETQAGAAISDKNPATPSVLPPEMVSHQGISVSTVSQLRCSAALLPQKLSVKLTKGREMPVLRTSLP
jgi:hypothetical protein